MIERFSHSSLETFKKCPVQFKIRYLDKVLKPDESIEAFLGKRLHETVEYLYNTKGENGTPMLDIVMDKFQEYWESSWHNRIGIVRWREYRAEDYYALGEKCLAKFYRQYKPFDEPAVGNELELVFHLDDSKNYKIKGILDRVDHDGSGKWEIHDYKSGKRALTQGAANRDTQLALYQIGLEKKFDNVNEVELVWHFLQHGIEMRSRRTKEELKLLSENIKTRIDNIRTAIADKHDFPAKESILCNWCYYWDECPAKYRPNPFIRKY